MKARCPGPNPPNIPSQPSPADGEVDVALSIKLSVYVQDGDGGLLSVSFFNASDNSQIGASVSVTSGSRAESTISWPDLSYSSTYSWYAIVEDPEFHSVQSPTWSFTTMNVPNIPPNVPYNPNPADHATAVDIDKNCTWGCSDDDGNLRSFNVYFWEESGSPDLVAENITDFEYDPGTMSYATNYSWYIVAWDDLDENTQGPEWTFETVYQGNNPPRIIHHYPYDESDDIALQPECRVTVYDFDDDSLTVDFSQSTNNVSFATMQSTSGVNSNETVYWTYSDATNYPVTYWWKVEVDDGEITTTKIYSFNTSLKFGVELAGPEEDYSSYYIDEYYTFNVTIPLVYTSYNRFLKFDWGDSIDYNWAGPYQDITRQQFTYNWSEAGTYTIKIRAVEDYNNDGHGGPSNSSDGVVSDWSNSIVVNIKNRYMPPKDSGNNERRSFSGSSGGTITASSSLEGIVRIDLYSDSYPPSSGSAVLGTVPFGQVYIFDLGLIAHEFLNNQDLYMTIFQNGGVLKTVVTSTYVEECSNIYGFGDLLIFKVALIRGLNTVGGSGSGTYKVSFNIVNHYIRNHESYGVSNFKMEMFGKYKDPWYTYLINPARTFKFSQLNGNSDVLIYNDGERTNLILSSFVVEVNIDGIL